MAAANDSDTDSCRSPLGRAAANDSDTDSCRSPLGRAAANDSDTESYMSPVVRAKQLMDNVGNMLLSVPSPFFRKRADTSNRSKSQKIKASDGLAGYRSAPDRVSFGMDFPHLKILRDVCKRSFGGGFKNSRQGSVSGDYACLYGATDDLITELESTNDEEETTEEIKYLKDERGSCPHLFDKVKVSDESKLCPVPWRSYIESPKRVSTGDLETYVGDKTSPCLKIRCNSFGSKTFSPASNRSSFERETKLGLLRKESLENLISYHTEKDQAIVDNDKQASTQRHEGTCRIKIGLQYFKNTRQLRVLLLTVKLLKAMYCKIFVKLSLFDDSSKQTMTSRKIHCESLTVELNELLYIEQQNGWTSGKFLRIRLCKESRFVRRVKSIGEAMVALDDLDISSDTSIWLLLRKPKSHEMVSPQFEIVSDSERSKDDIKAPLLADTSLPESDIQLLLESTRSYVPANDMKSDQTM